MSVMIDPRTGEILAMASVPTYNPNDPADAAKRGARNRTISDTFEPGSTLKTFTFAAALDAGKVRPEDRFDCQMGQLQVGKFHIRDDHPKGVLTAAEVFKYSSNIGTVKIARRIGKEALWNALDRFGFGRPTYVGLPGERRGILRPVSRWGEIEFATHAFGQGLTVTPLQLAAGFAAIAAYGVYHPPLLALHYIGSDGKARAGGAAAGGARSDAGDVRARRAHACSTIMQGVTEDGTAKAAAIPGYPVAGKTGTAQKVSNGRYDPSKFLASFVGIVPADNPRLVIAVMIDEPQGIHYGGVVAAPAFKAIAESALRYLGVAPSSRASGARQARQAAQGAEQARARAGGGRGRQPGLDEPAAVLASEQGDADDGALAEDDETPAAPGGGPVAVSRLHRHEHGRGHPGRAQGRRGVGSLGQRRGDQPVAQARSGVRGHRVPGFLPTPGRLEGFHGATCGPAQERRRARASFRVPTRWRSARCATTPAGFAPAISSWRFQARSRTDASSSPTPWPRARRPF